MKKQAGSGPYHGVDGLRFLSALMVVFFHYTCYGWMPASWQPVGRAALGTTPAVDAVVPVTSNGWIGVQVFFVISGFVIILSAAGKTPFAFFAGRILRIIPTLFFFTSLALIVTLAYSHESVLTTLAMFAKSVTLFPKGPWIDGVVWTLTVEAFFYLIVFLLIQFRLFDSIESITYFWGALTSFVMISLFAAYMQPFRPDLSVFAERVERIYALRLVLVTTGPFFAAGAVSAFIARSGFTPMRTGFLTLFLAAGCIGVHFSALALPVVAERSYSTLPAVAAWLGAVLIMLAIVSPAGRRWSSPLWLQELLRVLGLITFPLYLLHNITGVWVLGRVIDRLEDPFLSIGVTTALLIAACYIYLKVIEPPLKHALSSGLNAAAAATPRRPEPAGVSNT